MKSAPGQVKLVHVTPRTEDGSLSSIDVVTASTLVVKAIETAKPLTKPAPKTTRANSRAAKLRMLADRSVPEKQVIS